MLLHTDLYIFDYTQVTRACIQAFRDGALADAPPPGTYTVVYMSPVSFGPHIATSQDGLTVWAFYNPHHDYWIDITSLGVLR